MSFVEQEGVMELVEGLLRYSWPPELGGLSQPFPCITYSEAMRDYGSDKPDTRFHMKVWECVCVCVCVCVCICVRFTLIIIYQSQREF